MYSSRDSRGARFGFMPRCHVAAGVGGRGRTERERETERERINRLHSTTSVDLSPIFVEDKDIMLQC
jgi:hypothetical protein